MDQIEDRLILPTLRRALMLTANQMTAKESYAEKRAQFISDAWDQVLNGVYIVKDVTEKVIDPVSGREVTRTSKVPEGLSSPSESINGLISAKKIMSRPASTTWAIAPIAK
jgi:hypothetical protein